MHRCTKLLLLSCYIKYFNKKRTIFNNTFGRQTPVKSSNSGFYFRWGGTSDVTFEAGRITLYPWQVPPLIFKYSFWGLPRSESFSKPYLKTRRIKRKISFLSKSCFRNYIKFQMALVHLHVELWHFCRYLELNWGCHSTQFFETIIPKTLVAFQKSWTSRVPKMSSKTCLTGAACIWGGPVLLKN